ncbi:hypothetical protein AN644_04315 [Candidatus Epulonipiscium fishelsonii]|nr:hypothetical protein AN644_04315 [Epulopiscium sp. SCG-C06WGA-EpuloA1]
MPISIARLIISIVIGYLSKFFDISHSTVRRELRDIEISQIIKRTHGDARLHNKNIEKLSYVITDNKLSEELVDLYKTKYKLLVATA